MEAFNNSLIANIVFLLLQCTSHMRAEVVSMEYKRLPGGFNVFLQNGVQPEFNAVKMDYKTECAHLCMNEVFCKMWRFGDERCQLFHPMKDKVIGITSSNTNVNTYYETGGGELHFLSILVDNIIIIITISLIAIIIFDRILIRLSINVQH